MATASEMCVSPSTCGAPVTEEPGARPRLPNMVVGPVFVTVDPASTEKGVAVPRPMDAAAAMALEANSKLEHSPRRTAPARSAFRGARDAQRRPDAGESLRGDSGDC